jgi:hypothetical protein
VKGLLILSPQLVQTRKHRVRVGREALTRDRAPRADLPPELSVGDLTARELADECVVTSQTPQISTVRGTEVDEPSARTDETTYRPGLPNG